MANRAQRVYAGSGSYCDLDNFGRILKNDWTRGSAVPYVDFRLAYDHNGNITSESDELVKRRLAGGRVVGQRPLVRPRVQQRQFESADQGG